MKKRKSQHSPSRFVPEDKYSPSTYLRLCHRCLFLNESGQYIEKCTRCESSFAEFSSNPKADYKNLDFEETDPIHEAIADFESERVRGGENWAQEPSVESDEDDDVEGEQSIRKKRGTPISGLSVFW